MLGRHLPLLFLSAKVEKKLVFLIVHRELYLSKIYSLNFEISSASASRLSSLTLVSSPLIRLFLILPAL